MGKGNEAYYLKDMELALLLSIKGMRELYGMKMNGMQGMGLEAVCQTLFGLGKKGVAAFQDGRTVIQPELNRMMDDIKSAKMMLLYLNGASKHPDQCVYLGREAVFVSAYGKTGEMNRMESVPMPLAPEKLCEYGFYLKDLASDGKLCREAEIGDPELEGKAGGLFGKEFSGAEEWQGVTDCLRMVSLGSRKCIRQYLLMGNGLDDYFAVTGDGVSHVYVYSKRKVMDVLREDLLGMQTGGIG